MRAAKCTVANVLSMRLVDDNDASLRWRQRSDSGERLLQERGTTTRFPELLRDTTCQTNESCAGAAGENH
jgi:hypothetical protein